MYNTKGSFNISKILYNTIVQYDSIQSKILAITLVSQKSCLFQEMFL